MKLISEETKGRVAVITLRTENPFNPISMEMLEEIEEVIRNQDRIVVIKGDNRAFSAGADISRFPHMTPADAFHFSQRGHEIMDLIASRDMPVIAAIHGFALGGGLELALSCDVRIAHPNTVFGLPEVTLGILPGFGGTQRLKSLVGEGRAYWLVSTGSRFKADDALSWGVLTEISENFSERALEIARQYEQLPYESLVHIKKLIRPIERANLDREMEYFANLFLTENRDEGVSAFLDKRKPNFNQKHSSHKKG